jgi:hypothetical protein
VERIRGKINTPTKHIFEDSWLFEYFLQHKIREVSGLGDLFTLIDDLASTVSEMPLREDLIVVESQEEYISILEDDIVIDESDE